MNTNTSGEDMTTYIAISADPPTHKGQKGIYIKKTKNEYYYTIL